MKSIRVLLADDHDLVRAGFRSLLRDFDGIEVVAEAGDGREAVQLAAEHRPDVVLMDLMMPGLNGMEATAHITRTLPEVHVVVLSMNAAEEYVLPVIRAGASGYLLKNVKPTELEQAVRTAANGEVWLTPAVSRFVVDEYRRQSRDERMPLERLTPRLREVLQLVAEGRTTKEIAKRLSLSVKTVETYRTQLMDVLDIHDIAGLTRFAVRHGLVSPEA